MTSADVLSSVANPQTQQTAGSSADVLKSLAQESSQADQQQRFVTPGGKLISAPISQRDDLEKSGHTYIAPDGRFSVKPIEGEAGVDTMARAVRVAKALGPEQMQKSIEAEKNFQTSPEGIKDESKGLANVGIVTAGTLGSILGPGLIGGSVPIARAVGTAAGTAVRLARTPLGKAVLTKTLEGAGLGAAYTLAKKWLGL